MQPTLRIGLHTRCDKESEAGGQVPEFQRFYLLLLLRGALCGGKTALEAPFPPIICCGYFGLPQNAKTVIEITNNRDARHLPCR